MSTALYKTIQHCNTCIYRNNFLSCKHISTVPGKTLQSPEVLSSLVSNNILLFLEFIEAFVVIMYDRTTTTFPVNKARLEMLARKQRQYDAIPPTRAALLEHTKREPYLPCCSLTFSTKG
jgi:hypothetical protein